MIIPALIIYPASANYSAKVTGNIETYRQITSDYQH
ncbi:hypothetical protein YPF_4554 [Yersinia pestis biovar Orientalis str. India 195]|nr:hypothetical protein YPF_4554 [Yersinia pestis biovar Orientalis str. India 195]EEO85889.1 hypothetical protein YPH_1776 [Yersinia pestis biovar Orientalis str. PEXU2]EEO92069.1 hypothetical protein YPS_1022 [Yersinia pestis Pestoides A]